MMARKIAYSGVQPSGGLTIGNYLGAVSNFTKLENDYDCLFNVANMHAITVEQDPAELRRKNIETLAIFLAAGLSPEKSILFIQSDCPEHAELCWVLNSVTYMGELGRMTQFKDKSKKNEDNLNSALFTYPVLMAADILLYNTNLVPVGDDQRQHIEITRDIAIRFNNRYGETFVVPEALYSKEGARIMSLQNPDQKMSKSDEDENATIRMLDEPNVIIKKVKRAVTDSLAEINYSDEQAGLKNLFNIYGAFTGEKPEEIANRYSGQGYGVLKNDLGEVIVESLSPIRETYNKLMSDIPYLEKVAREGAEKASKIASKTIDKVYRKVGFR
ncbi:MAG: tryptophan--tRNA ligase [Tissierellia bacterium]|nr:tryptophan--tRNA ligase [Tissierellia bacterium]